MVDQLKNISGGAGAIEAIPVMLVAPADGSAGDPQPSFTPGGFTTAGFTFTRPADTIAYAAGDLVADSTTAATVPKSQNVMRAVGEAVRIERVRLRKTSVTLTNASFRVHLFRTPPVLSVNDNQALMSGSVMAVADISGYVGFSDITMDIAGAAGACGRGLPSTGAGMTFEAAGTVGDLTTVWAIIQATAAYVPTSGETFTLILEGARS